MTGSGEFCIKILSLYAFCCGLRNLKWFFADIIFELYIVAKANPNKCMGFDFFTIHFKETHH